MQIVLISYLANLLGHNDIMFLEINLVSKLGIIFSFAFLSPPPASTPPPHPHQMLNRRRLVHPTWEDYGTLWPYAFVSSSKFRSSKISGVNYVLKLLHQLSETSVYFVVGCLSSRGLC
jgi:hypothetical protein